MSAKWENSSVKHNVIKLRSFTGLDIHNDIVSC